MEVAVYGGLDVWGLQPVGVAFAVHRNCGVWELGVHELQRVKLCDATLYKLIKCSRLDQKEILREILN